MWTTDVLKSRAFRLALAFALAIAAAATVVFTLIYLQFSSASEQMVGARLTDEATRALDVSDDELRAQIKQRLVSDLLRLDYAGLFDAKGDLLLGDLPSLPPIRADGRPHLVATIPMRGAGRPDQTIFVAVRRADGSILVSVGAFPRSTICAGRWRDRWRSRSRRPRFSSSHRRILRPPRPASAR